MRGDGEEGGEERGRGKGSRSLLGFCSKGAVRGIEAPGGWLKDLGGLTLSHSPELVQQSRCNQCFAGGDVEARRSRPPGLPSTRGLPWGC